LRKIIFLMAVVMSVSLVMEFLKPIKYRSTVIALSPKKNSQAGSLGKYLGLPDLSMGGSSDEIIFSMLKSRRMNKDINGHFKEKKKRGFWWSLDTYRVMGGFAVEVTGSDPKLTKEIANFSVENLEKINLELDITSQKPMVKVLDPAIEGAPIKRYVFKKVLVRGIFVFLLYALFIFFREYFSQLRNSRK